MLPPDLSERRSFECRGTIRRIFAWRPPFPAVQSPRATQRTVSHPLVSAGGGFDGGLKPKYLIQVGRLSRLAFPAPVHRPSGGTPSIESGEGRFSTAPLRSFRIETARHEDPTRGHRAGPSIMHLLRRSPKWAYI